VRSRPEALLGLREPCQLALALLRVTLGLGPLQFRPRVELRGGLSARRLVDDGVALVDGLGLMADHRHRHRARHSGPLSVSDGCRSKLVKELPRIPGILARRPPRPTHIPNPSTLGPVENIRHDSATLLELRDREHLPFQSLAQFRGEFEVAAFAVLRDSGFQPNDTRDQVDLRRLQRRNLAPESPSGDVGEGHGRVNGLWKMVEDVVELLALEPRLTPNSGH